MINDLLFPFVPSNQRLEDPSKSLPPPGLGNILVRLLGRDFVDSGYEIHLVHTNHFGLLPKLVPKVDDREQDLGQVIGDEISRKVLGVGLLDCLACVGQFSSD